MERGERETVGKRTAWKAARCGGGSRGSAGPIEAGRTEPSGKPAPEATTGTRGPTGRRAPLRSQPRARALPRRPARKASNSRRDRPGLDRPGPDRRRARDHANPPGCLPHSRGLARSAGPGARCGWRARGLAVRFPGWSRVPPAKRSAQDGGDGRGRPTRGPRSARGPAPGTGGPEGPRSPLQPSTYVGSISSQDS